MDTQEFVEVVDDDLLCTICHCVMLNPHSCSQGHQFCHHCITTWLQQSSTCPADRGELFTCGLAKLRVAENLINRLNVRCIHSAQKSAGDAGENPMGAFQQSGERSDGCEWIGPLGNRALHLRDNCLFEEVCCGFEGCNLMVRREKLSEHRASCGHRNIQCAKCAESIQALEVTDHLLRCKSVKIECPHGCGTTLLRRDVALHELSCENVVVGCCFEKHGCEVRGKRRKISEHEAEAVYAHAHLAARRADRQEQEIARHIKSLVEKTRQVAALHEQVSQLKEELAQSRLSTSQREHEAAELRAKLAHGQGEARVLWRITRFEHRAKGSDPVSSSVFPLHTRAGVCHLMLSLQFSRRTGSRTRGFVRVAVFAASEQGVSFPVAADAWQGVGFPVSVDGTQLWLTHNTTRKDVAWTMQRHSVLEHVNDFTESETAFTVDRIAGLKWAEDDAEIDSEGLEIAGDISDFLNDDDLVVRGTIRVSEEICV